MSQLIVVKNAVVSVLLHLQAGTKCAGTAARKLPPCQSFDGPLLLGFLRITISFSISFTLGLGFMGRYDFRPLRVHQTASQLFASERIKHVPSWHEVVGTIPPAQTLVRTQPLQHQERPRRSNVRKPSKVFQPQRVVYEEDTLRKEFFGDHPWELARPRVVLENDGKDAERKDWSLLSQPDGPVDGER